MGDVQFPRIGVCAAIWREGRVALVTRTKPPLIGIWGMPGGHLEWGETLEQGVLRELREEANIEATIDALVDVRDVLRRSEAGGLDAHYAIIIYAGRWLSGELLAGDDAGEARWAQPEELGDLDLVPGTVGLVARSRQILDRLR